MSMHETLVTIRSIFRRILSARLDRVATSRRRRAGSGGRSMTRFRRKAGRGATRAAATTAVTSNASKCNTFNITAAIYQYLLCRLEDSLRREEWRSRALPCDRDNDLQNSSTANSISQQKSFPHSGQTRTTLVYYFPASATAIRRQRARSLTSRATTQRAT